MSLKRIRLELARTPDYPQRQPLHGYEFVAPLDDGGHLSSVELAQAQGRVHGAPLLGQRADDEHGALIHRRDGSWAFSYAPGEDDDEPIFKFDRHLLHGR